MRKYRSLPPTVLLVRDLLYSNGSAEATTLADNSRYLCSLIDSSVCSALSQLTADQLEAFAAAANRTPYLHNPTAWARATADHIRERCK